VGKTDPCYEAFSVFADPEISGQPFLLLSGDQLESDGHYLRLRLTAPESFAGLVVWLPHRLVVVAVSDEQNRPLGFGA